MKKTLLIELSLVFVFACSTKGIHETATPGSSIDSTGITEAYDEPPEFPDMDTMALAFETAIDDIANRWKEHSAYSLDASFSGYETGADATYYFTKDLQLSYCMVTWSMEGTSGTYSYFFQNDSLVAGREENQYNDFQEVVLIHPGFRPIFGFSKTEGADADSIPSYISEEDYVTKNSNALNEFSRLLDRLRAYADSVTVGDHVVTLHLENIVNYGQEFTETEDFRIDKPVFDLLIRQ
jgi:hypothetical protein